MILVTKVEKFNNFQIDKKLFQFSNSDTSPTCVCERNTRKAPFLHKMNVFQELAIYNIEK